MRTFRGGVLFGLVIAFAIAAAFVAYERYDTRTLKRTIRRGEVLCGVNTGLPGFSIPDDKGHWTGRHLRRSDQGEIRSARRQRALQGTAEPQGRYSLPQFDLEHVARNVLRPL